LGNENHVSFQIVLERLPKRKKEEKGNVEKMICKLCSFSWCGGRKKEILLSGVTVTK
jgi:hypothetical protein